MTVHDCSFICFAPHVLWSETLEAPGSQSNCIFLPSQLSVAVCIGFFAAWSPYAVVSMWAAFGQIKSIPPLAFAMPAMFAKSSTIYNPIVYLLLRPNFRKVMWRDLGLLQQACFRCCTCSTGPQHSKTITLQPQRKQPHSFHSKLSGCMVKESVCEKCNDAFECFRHYPKACHLNTIDNSTSLQCPIPNTTLPLSMDLKQQHKTTRKKSVRVRMWGRRREDIEHFKISLETMPGHAKVAWP